MTPHSSLSLHLPHHLLETLSSSPSSHHLSTYFSIHWHPGLIFKISFFLLMCNDLSSIQQHSPVLNLSKLHIATGFPLQWHFSSSKIRIPKRCHETQYLVVSAGSTKCLSPLCGENAVRLLPGAALLRRTTLRVQPRSRMMCGVQ